MSRYYIDLRNEVPDTLITFAVFQELPDAKQTVWLKADVPEKGSASLTFEKVYDVVVINYSDPVTSGVYASQQKRRTKPGAIWELKIKNNIKQLVSTSQEAPDGEIHIINKTGTQTTVGLAISGSVIQRRFDVLPDEVAKFDLTLKPQLGVLANLPSGQIITYDIVEKSHELAFTDNLNLAIVTVTEVEQEVKTPEGETSTEGETPAPSVIKTFDVDVKYASRPITPLMDRNSSRL
ncbi:10240_t:CDS:2 [Ambispora gerdemannii]|uniref:10240_t:CDS:1 n=1 Tax=Ambispora gerdemannii TaxID=144530 RepID=A0A9N8WRA7_9GLOM|nr:10240_t:CDS:2 [Ambispora gerdemannii]